MEKEEHLRVKGVETFTDDMVKTLANEKGSTIKKIIHQEEEKEVRKKNLSPESLKNRTFMIIGFILIIMALIAMASAALLGEKTAVVPLETPFAPAVFTDKNSFNEIKDLTAKEILSLIAAQVSGTDVKQNGVTGIFLLRNGQPLRFPDFVSLIKGHFPSDGFSAVKDFMLGAYNGQSGRDLFLLLKTASFSDIFNPLRAWERKMFSDLSGMFGKDLTAENKYLQTKDFTDGVVQNKNARILYDASGGIALLYMFADENSIIITDSIQTAEEIMSRLSSGKVAK